MSIVVSSIVEMSLNKIALQIHVSADDWTAERAIIASKGLITFTDFVHLTMKVILNIFRISFYENDDSFQVSVIT